MREQNKRGMVEEAAEFVGTVPHSIALAFPESWPHCVVPSLVQ